MEMDRLISRHTLSDMTRCVILDACGTTAIEDYCDKIENYLRTQLSKENLYLTSRFSCGYGDLPISLQPLILEKTDAYRRALISCNESFMLIPLKSVSAIMGISDAPTARTKCRKNCKDCSLYETCRFKRND
ncbi:hypothetical protein SDC9_172645 [bioreactor metagenome]|uniref:AdoMet activation domain-containing protein n=1 Tax=bioreactor metagenome TaxID=1076179 RepID=A0A645GEB2_9ZZZZ